MKEFFQWKALIYEQDLAKEETFLECIKHLEDILLVEVLGHPDSSAILAKVVGANVQPRECLMVVTEDETRKLAHSLGIATLAYLCPDREHPQFVGEEMLVEGFEEIDYEFLERRYQRFHQIPWTIAVTKRCRIRELTLEDLPALFGLYAEPHMTDYVEPLFPWEEELEYQKAYIANMYHYYGFGMWLIFEKDTDRLIGRAGLEMREYENGSGVELGYIIAPEYQRQGYAFEVCQAILHYAEELGFSEINCLIEPENTGSMAFARRLGFTRVGKMHTGDKDFCRFILHLPYCFLDRKNI